MCPKLLEFAKICPETTRLRNFEIPPKFEIFMFFIENKKSMCRGSTTTCIQSSLFGFTIQ
jgi:hypothetical protein